MCILVCSIVIAEQQRVCLLKCCANVVLSLSPWETDDENNRAMLPRCSAGFVIDVEQFSSQFNSAHLYYVIYYMLFSYVKINLYQFHSSVRCQRFAFH